MQIQIAAIDESIVDLDLDKKQKTSAFKNQLLESYNNLKSNIDKWYQSYVLTAPCDGTVSFTNIWNENQTVKTGDKLLTIIPEKQGSLIGKVKLPIQGAGKVDTGLVVNIKFDNYPYMEFGMLRGKITSKSLIATDNMYYLELKLPDSLTTNYGKHLDFERNLQGIAEIITEDRRMIERVFTPLKYILKKQ